MNVKIRHSRENGNPENRFHFFKEFSVLLDSRVRGNDNHTQGLKKSPRDLFRLLKSFQTHKGKGDGSNE